MYADLGVLVGFLESNSSLPVLNVFSGFLDTIHFSSRAVVKDATQ